MTGEFYLYRHIRLDTNEPFYIGIGTKPKVFHGHRTEYKRAYTTFKRTEFWKNVTAKTDYRVEIMLESDNLNFIKEKEVEFIDLYGRKDTKTGSLVNLTDGGELNKGFIPSEETKKKISLGSLRTAKQRAEKMRGRKASQETKEVLSEMRKDPYFHKHLLTKESIEKARVSRRANSREVIHLESSKQFNSLIEGCEFYGLNYNYEWTKIKRNYKTAKFRYI
jgi:hypothetical protein